MLYFLVGLAIGVIGTAVIAVEQIAALQSEIICLEEKLKVKEWFEERREGQDR